MKGDRVCLVPLFLMASAVQQPIHDRQFWHDIQKNKYSAPSGTSVSAMSTELSEYLSSPDPELRDDLAYTILDVWIVYRPQLSEAELLPLLDEWQDNLRVGVGESGTDSVLGRSFSALCLAAIAERDLKTPFLGEQRYRLLLENALKYLGQERGLRGFDSVKGWIHATAHTADLITFLAANSLFKVEDQQRVLQAIAERLVSAHQIFSYGEQDRLAAAIAAIAARQDFDAAGFHQWISALDQRDREVWKTSPPDDNKLQTLQNNSYLLQALTARLYSGPKTPGTARTLEEVTRVLQRRL
jgi:hypothetical protein